MNDINEYHVTWFDGGGTTGWADFVIDVRAFTRPENKVLRHVKSWDCGEFSGNENTVFSNAVAMVRRKVSINGDNISYLRYDVGGEDFDLVQTIGGKNLLSPVRFNAVMDWECSKLGIQYRYQARQLRTGTTPERLRLFTKPIMARGPSKPPRWSTSGKGKDAFAAMQHMVYWLRSLKQKSLGNPWKLGEGSVLNAYYDCACRTRATGRYHKRKCDLVHPM